MNTTRETKTVTTPGGAVIELKTYITGREQRQLTGIFMKDGLNIDIETQKITGIKSGVADLHQDEAFKIVVVSVNGSKENIIDTILDMRAEEYEFIVKEINKVTSTEAQQKKTTK